MIIQGFVILLLFGVLGNIFVSKKLDKFFSLMALLLSVGFLYMLVNGIQEGLNRRFMLEWLNYMSLQVNIDLSSNKTNYIYILPMLIVSVASILIAVFNKEEERKQRFSCLCLLNLCAYISLVCSANLLQLLVSSCLMTILGFCIIDDMDARKKYAFYNLLSDLSLFSICSLVYGYVGNLDTSALSMYGKLGAHRDLVAVLLILSISLKSGLFMFHNQLYDMSVLQFNRLNWLLYASAPLAGFIILQKVLPLTAISDFALPIFQTISLLTVVCGMYSAVAIDNLKEKAVGLAQMFYGFAFWQLTQDSSSAVELLNILVLCGYMLGLLLYGIYYASSYEQNVSKMGGFIGGLKIFFVLLTLAFGSIIHFLLSENKQSAALVFAIVLLLTFAHILRQIFFGKTRADERVFALLRFPSWYLFLPIAVLTALLIWKMPHLQTELLYFGTAYIFLLFFDPLSKTAVLYEKEAVQESDVFEDVFDFLIVTPLTILGRILWLLVDFILIERTMINSLSNCTSFLIRNVGRLNVFSWGRSSLYLLASMGLLALCAYGYVKG